MKNDEFRGLIERGDVEGIRNALECEAGLANRPIRWHLNQPIESDPLHYVSDCVGNGWLTNGSEGDVASLLISHGAAIEGAAERETPLIGSVSLGAPRVSKVLIEAGADLEAASIFGARALHWAAWVGASCTVDLLLAHGAQIEARCAEFGATPLFWAVHGYSPDGPQAKGDQVGAARSLIGAGADLNTQNKHGVWARDLSRRCKGRDMDALLDPSV